jgi:hypothetical protein
MRAACDEETFMRHYQSAYGSLIDRRHRRPAPDRTEINRSPLTAELAER